MRKRLRSLFKVIAIPAWAILLWETAEPLERVEYINDKRRQVWELAVTPEGRVLLLIGGFLWLTAVILWPELKERLPAALTFTTVDERLEKVESQQIPGIEAAIEDWRRQTTVLKILSDEHGALLRDLSSRIMTVESALPGVNSRVDEHRSWILELERNIVTVRDTTRGRLDSMESTLSLTQTAVKSAPVFVSQWVESWV